MKMKTSWMCGAALLALGAMGCPTGPGTPLDGGSLDADVEFPDLEITVSGTAAVHPDAVAYFQSKGQPVPTIDGLTLRVEEPLKVALSDPLGIFGTVSLSDAGTFRVEKVPVELVNLGIAAGIKDDFADGGCGADGGTCGRVIRSATAIYDVALEQKKPDRDIAQAKAYAIPTAFHDQLTQAITVARIQQITGGTHSSLIEAGMMLGRIVDASGNPVQNAKVAPSPASLESQFFYPTADLTGTQAATSSNGLFVFVHTGGAVNTFRYTVDGKPEYLQRNAGAAKEACLVMTVYPGKTPPP